MVLYLLKLYKHDDYPPYLLKAIDTANMFLNVHSRMPSMVSEDIALDVYYTIDVEFQADAQGAYAWTYSNECSVVYVNRVIPDRLELLGKCSKTTPTKEYNSLVLTLAYLLVHGCANLMGRWLKPMVSTKYAWIVPPSIKRLRAEAHRVFGGNYRLLVEKPPGAKAHVWTEAMPVHDFVTQTKTRDVGVNAHGLRKFLATVPHENPGIWLLKESDPDRVPMYKTTRLKRSKRAMIHLDTRDPATTPQDQASSGTEEVMADASDRPNKKPRTD